MDPTVTTIRHEVIDTGQDEHIKPEALILHYDYGSFARYHLCMRHPDGSMTVPGRHIDRTDLEAVTACFMQWRPKWLASWQAETSTRIV